jgi:CRP-like cAMP-binding protein
VEAYRDLGDKRVVLDTLSAGQFFGEMNLFDPGTATASIRSLTPARTLEISNEQFVQFMRYKPEAAADFMFQLTQVIVKRLRNTTDSLTQELMSPENLKRAVQIDRGLPA